MRKAMQNVETEVVSGG